jgi:hypothetical protein
VSKNQPNAFLPASGLDLGQLTPSRSDEGAWLEAVDPVSGRPNGVRLKLAGMDSRSYRQAQREASNRRLSLMARRGAKYRPRAEELEAEALSLLVAVTLDWEGISENGQPLACTPENVREVYAKVPWLSEQADDFVGDRANFLRS